MAKGKKGESGKRMAKRVGSEEEAQKQREAAEKKSEKKRADEEEEESRSALPKRIQEKDSGFGVVKFVVIGVIVLIIGSMMLTGALGGRDSARGDKVPGELCEETVECQKGSLCFLYKTDRKRCHATCSEEKKCEPGSTCTSAAEQSGRKGTRVRAICVENAKL